MANIPVLPSLLGRGSRGTSTEFLQFRAVFSAQAFVFPWHLFFRAQDSLWCVLHAVGLRLPRRMHQWRMPGVSPRLLQHRAHKGFLFSKRKKSLSTTVISFN